MNEISSSLIETFVTFFICLVALTSSEAHIYSSIVSKTKKLDVFLQISYTTFIYLILFMFEGVIGSFINSLFHDYITFISFSFFVLISFLSLYNSVDQRDFKSVRRIVYESKIMKYQNSMTKLFKLSNSEENSVVEPIQDENNQVQADYNLINNLKNDNQEEKANQVEEEQYEAEGRVTLKFETIKTQKSKGNSRVKTNENVQENNISSSQINNNLEVGNNEETLNQITKIDSQQNIHIEGLFHHEINNMTQAIFEQKIVEEDTENVYEFLFVLTSIIVSAEFESYNFYMFSIFSLIIDKQVFIFTSIFTAFFFFTLILTTNGKLDSICFIKLRSIIYGFSMIICASYTYNKDIKY